MRSAFRLDKCPVIIAIGSSNEKRTMRNPLTVKERAEMIRRVLSSSEGIKTTRYTIIPIKDIGNDALWLAEVEKRCRGKFGLVMTGNLYTAHIFRKAGYRVIRPHFFRKKECNATHIRSLIHRGKKWESLVPKIVLGYLNEKGLVEIIRESRNNNIVCHQNGGRICKRHRG